MQTEQLQKIWKEWKNVILVTVAVIVVTSAMFWMPPIVGMFESDPAKITKTTNDVINMMWWVVFLLAAQSIFSNRKKRKEMKEAREGNPAALDAPAVEEKTPFDQ